MNTPPSAGETPSRRHPPQAKTRPPHVEIIPLGIVDGVATSVAAANLQAIAGLPADVLPPRPEPADAFIPARRQYNALTIIQELEKNTPKHILRLGVIDSDLCVPILSYVIGEARVGGHAAVVSLHRLKHGPDGHRVPVSHVYQRLAKVVLHEIAHILGLTHCQSQRCLMRFSLNATHIDHLAATFCPTCENALMVARRRRSSHGV